MRKVLKCVKVGSKLKVSVVGEDGFVQFPVALRKEGKYFSASISWNGKFWKLNGPPERVSEEEIQAAERQAKIQKMKSDLYERI